jgi:predicted RNA-binding protein with PIN domain
MPPRQLLIDGYNVIYADPRLAALPLELSRRALVQLTAKYKSPDPWVSAHVVFDGRADQELSESYHAQGPVTVVFVPEGADGYMRETLRDSTHPEQWVVVTDDREIRYTAADHGAQQLSVRQFRSRTPHVDVRRPHTR